MLPLNSIMRFVPRNSHKDAYNMRDCHVDMHWGDHGVCWNLLGTRTAHRRHRLGAHHQRDLYVAFRRHRRRCAAACGLRPDQHHQLHHRRRDWRGRGRHGGRLPQRHKRPVERGHFRLPRDARHHGRARQQGGWIGGFRCLGGQAHQDARRRAARHLRARRAHLHRRLLQLPHGWRGHASRDR